MYCPNCGRSIPDQSKFCMECGSKMPPATTHGGQPVYRPSIPDGFQLDVESGLYYRTTGEFDSQSGHAVTRTVYYDPVTGEYQNAPEPEAQSASEPETPEPEPTPQLPVIPEGYRLDPVSGFYYKSADGVDAEGRPVRWVTYLDPDKGTFKQIPYPISQPETPEPTMLEESVDNAQDTLAATTDTPVDVAPPSNEFTEKATDATESPFPVGQTVAVAAPAAEPGTGGSFPPPEGYILDPRSGFYYRSENGPDPATGQPAQLVTYFDTATGATKTIAYPLAAVPAAPSEGMPPVPAPYPYEAKKKPLGDSKIAAIVIIVLFIIVVVAAGIALGLHRSLPFFGGSESEQSQVSQDQSVPESSQVEEQEEEEKEEESQTPDTPARAAVPPGQPIESWVQFGHTSEYYMRVGEDSTHIYYMDGYSYWSQDLYRMDKTDDPVIEDLTGSWLHYGVSAFALVGDDIYFGTKLDEYRAAYYRMSKLGGDAEFLFIQEISHLVEDNGVLYFLFDEQDAVGVFRPEFDLLPELIPLSRGGDTEDFMFYWDEFSIYNDWLYYGEVWYDTCVYIRFNLSTREHQVLLDGAILGEDNLYNIIYDGDTCYYNQWDDDTGTNYLRTATMGGSTSEVFSETTLPSGDYLFIARVDDDLIYQEGGYEFFRAPLGTPYLGDELFTMYTMPFAITQEWLFFEDEAISLTDGHSISLWDTIDGPAVDLVDFDRVLELADMYPDEYAINIR